MELKELLNELIREGWKPRGKIDMEFMYMLGDKEHPIHQLFFKWGASGVISAIEQHHIREIVSKESGLWQFVCENGMVNKVDNDRRYFDELNDICYDKTFHDDECQYWIIESALCDEDKLEEFLLDNIKIGE